MMKYIIIIVLLVSGCNIHNLPSKKLNQVALDLDYEFVNDSTLQLNLTNPIHCPLRIWAKSKENTLHTFLQKHNPILLPPLTDTLIQYKIAESQHKISFSAQLGDPTIEVNVKKVALPFPKNRAYKLIQGYNSKPTHNTPTSRYALDFGLGVGDTVCAATNGYVIGVIEEYQHGGKGKKWKPFSNFITLYEPNSGLFTQYVHLKYKGSLVEVGDSIKVGQAIGLSGMTGQTTVEHLHFNCFKADTFKDGFISIDMDSIGNYKIADLKRYNIVKNE